MFIGQIGFTYVYGLQSVWLMFGLIFGDFISSLFVHKNLRKKSLDLKVISFANLVSQWHGKNYKYVQLFGGLIILIFLSTYAAAQLNAGSKSMHVIFGLDYRLGAIIGGVIVLLYCFSGGIRASIWTDAAQSFGASYDNKKSCSYGHVSATSFFPAKPLGGYGDGGAIFTNDSKKADIYRSIRVHGQGIDKYDNIRVGLNSRLDTIQAAVLLNKLKIFIILLSE